jgi:predicted lipoprotein with Yx(FWY)xxD motif
MKTSTIIWIIVAVVIIVGGVFWFMSESSSPAAPVVSTTQTTTVAATPTLGLGTSASLGSYLTASTNGLTLYTYAGDETGMSNCTGTCATTWPPYTVQSAADLEAGAGMTGALATLTRADGTLQVTYNGMPLYFYTGDVNPGDTNGNGVGNFSVAKP